MEEKTTPSEPWLYVISQVDKSLALEWFFRELYAKHTPIHIIFLHPKTPELQKYCVQLGYKTKWIKYQGKKDIPLAFIKTFSEIFTIRPSLIHTHLFDASLIGLSAAWLLRIKQRIHTRHHASMHHEYFQQAIKYDLFINKLSTKIIAISENIKNILIDREKVKAEKITVISHGFDLLYFNNVPTSRIDSIKQKYSITENRFVIGMISRYTHWKGIQYVIPAFKKIIIEFPNAFLVLANATGDYAKEIKELLNDLPENSYREIVFEKDSPALFKMFNVFVHVPIDDHSEAFGQVYIEALAANCPSIFTLSGIAKEFEKNEKNFTIVPFCDTDAIYFALRKIVLNLAEAQQEAVEGFNAVQKQFGIKMMIEKTLECYEG